MASSRQRFLDVDTEDDLLMLQEQMQKMHAAPAASVTRIKGASSHAPPRQAGTAATSTPLESNEQPGSTLGSAFVGEVKERATVSSPPAPPSLPLETSGASRPRDSFPAATHRKLSKFSLARKAPPTTQTRPPGKKSLLSDASEGVSDPSCNLVDETIGQENEQTLAAMSLQEIDEAQRELLQRLPPKTVEFLRRRHQKGASEGVQPSPMSLPSKLNTSGSASQRNDAGKGSNWAEMIKSKRGNVSEPMFGENIAARLRFDMEGAVAGLAPATGSVLDDRRGSQSMGMLTASVVSRDPIRAAEGTVPSNGYSITEAVAMTRSSVPQQRVFALRLLASILRTAKTKLMHEKYISSEILLSYVNIPEVSWTSVWSHALHEADVVVNLRVGLDDGNAAVVIAASEALEALLSFEPTLDSVLEIADAHPLVGWPGVPVRHLQRPGMSMPWVAAPLDLAERRERKRSKPLPPPQMLLQGYGDSEEEDDVDEKALAKVDPVSGLVNMTLLERISYILECFPGAQRVAAGVPLLRILRVLARAGRDVATKVATTPRLLDGIKSLLDDAESTACWTLGLRVARTLCQASPKAALQVHAAGFGRYLIPSFFHPPTSASASSRDDQLIECLRMWRCLAAHDRLFFVLHMDDAFGGLCPRLFPEVPLGQDDSSLKSGFLEGFEPSVSDWGVSREIYLTMAALCRHAARARLQETPDGVVQSAMISRECASAVARQSKDWLVRLPLETVIQAVSRPDQGSAEYLAAILSAVAAALEFLGAYHSDHTDEEDHLSVLVDLRQAGVLIAPKNDGGGPPCFPQQVRSLVERLMQQKEQAFLPCTEVIIHRFFTAAMAIALWLPALEAALVPTGIADTEQRPTAHVVLRPFIAPSVVTYLAARTHSPLFANRTLLEPRQASGYQLCLQMARAVVVAAEMRRMWTDVPLDVLLQVVLAALSALPPGADDLGVRLMACLFAEDAVARVLDSAHECLQLNGQGHLDELVLLKDEEASSRGGGLPGPKVPAAHGVARTLLSGYAAVWLGYVQETATDTSQDSSSFASNSAHLTGLSSIHLLRPDGSSLPLPQGWALQQIPRGHEANPSDSMAHALLWALGLDAFLSSKKRLPGLPLQMPPKAKEVVRFVFDSEFLVQMDGCVEPSKSSEDSWREAPVLRWAFVTLLERCLRAEDVAVAEQQSTSIGARVERSSSLWTIPEAQRLVARFASSSYGNPVFGIAVATLLHGALSPLDVQLEALSGLANERALRLLPSLQSCLGPPLAYLNAPLSEKRAPLPSNTHTQAEEKVYLDLIGSYEFHAAVQTSSAAVPLVLHRLAAAVFKDAEDSHVAGPELRTGALLLSAIVRRLELVNDANISQIVLGRLLRWDCTQGRVLQDMPTTRMAVLEGLEDRLRDVCMQAATAPLPDV